MMFDPKLISPEGDDIFRKMGYQIYNTDVKKGVIAYTKQARTSYGEKKEVRIVIEKKAGVTKLGPWPTLTPWELYAAYCFYSSGCWEFPDMR